MRKSEKDMPFSKEQLSALTVAIREVIAPEFAQVRAEIGAFRKEVYERFDQVAGQIDGLYLRDEKREHEYLALRHQVTQLEKRVG